MSTPPLDILIAGGGICGLSCAIALRRSGHSVRILERSQFSNEVGAAITLPPNAVRILESWDLDFQKARMIKFQRMDVVTGEGDSISTLSQYHFSVSKRDFGSSFLLSHRVDLHEALRNMATSSNAPGKPAILINGAHVASYDAGAGSVELTDGSAFSADLIIAADGVRSIASKFIEAFRPAILSDTMVVRFLVPTSTLLADPTTKDIVTGDGVCSIYTTSSKDRWLVRYPCRDNTLQTFGFYSIDKTKSESLELTFKSDRASLLRSLDGFHSSIIAAAAKANEVLPLWRCTSRDPLPHMYRGRLVLAGDAAHAMLPHLGQGAAQSIEDAAALGVLFQGITAEGIDNEIESIEARLKLFNEIRNDRVTAVQILSGVNVGDDDCGTVQERWEKYLPGHEFPRQKKDVHMFCNSHNVVRECLLLLDRPSEDLIEEIWRRSESR